MPGLTSERSFRLYHTNLSMACDAGLTSFNRPALRRSDHTVTGAKPVKPCNQPRPHRHLTSYLNRLDRLNPFQTVANGLV